MGFLLELPPSVGEEIRQEAARAGLSYEEQVTFLVYLGAALLGGPGDSSFGDAVRQYLAASGIQAEPLGDVLRRLVRECAEPEPAPSMPDALRRWRDAAVHAPPPGLVYPVRPEGAGSSRVAEHRSAFGKYAGMTSGSEEFARRKQEEIDLEDRRS
jgi:hypothetical protein